MPKGLSVLLGIAPPKDPKGPKGGAVRLDDDEDARKAALREARDEAAADLLKAIKADDTKAFRTALDDYFELRF